MKRKLLVPLIALAMLVGFAVVAQPAEATSLFRCPSVTPYAYTCTRMTGTVTVLDRQTGQNKTLYLNNSVGLMYWSWNFTPQLCGTHGDGYVWSISWYNNGPHWGVVGDTWLQTGADYEWGPHVADPYGNTFNPTFQLIPPSGTQGYCNSPYWSFMSGRI